MRVRFVNGFLFRRSLLAAPHALALDGDASGARQGRRERRRDQVLSRNRWQFMLRDEILCSWEEGTA